MGKIFLAVIATVLLAATSSLAFEVKLEWDLIESENPSGYKVTYIKACEETLQTGKCPRLLPPNGNYVYIENKTTCTLNLPENVTGYCFYLTSYRIAQRKIQGYPVNVISESKLENYSQNVVYRPPTGK